MLKILQLLKIIFEIIDPKLKIYFFSNILFNISANFLQILGLTSAIPFLTILINPGYINENKYLSHVYNFFNFDTELNFILFTGFTFLILVVIGNFLIGISTFLQVYVSQKITRDIQYKLTNFYFKKDYHQLLDQSSSQRRANITVSDALDNKFFFPITEIIPKSLIVIFLSLISIVLFPILTISVFLGVSFIFLVFTKLIKKRLDQTGHEIASANYKLNKLMFESFQIIKIVIINNAINFFMKDLMGIHKKLIKFNSFSHAISQIPRIILETILVCFIIVTSLTLYKTGSEYLVTTLTFFGIFGYKIFPNISHAYSYYTIMRSGINSFEYLKKDLIELIKTKYNDQEKDKDEGQFDNLKKLSIKIDNFKFGDDILFNKQVVNFFPNKINVLYGDSGAGKTTLINLLMGFIYSDEVKISVNDIELNKKNFHIFQNKIGFVPQKFELINDTIKNNITLGKDYNENTFNESIEISNLNDLFVNLNMRKEDTVGENNDNISGGQAQRISIARAIIKNPSLVILDEGTGQLDQETEIKILNKLIKKNYTIILITHRYDKLLELKDIELFSLKNRQIIHEKKK